MKKSMLAVACVSAMAIAVPVSATVIDFNSAPNGQTTLVLSGVTFTAGGAAISTTDYGNTPNGTRGIVARTSGGEFVPFRADIAGGTNFVSVDLGDYGTDADDIFLRAYDAADLQIGSDMFSLSGSFIGLQTLSVNAANIAYVTFGGAGFAGQSSVYGDNFTFNGATVPEPASWALMISGFGLIGGAMRRRQRVSVSFA